MAPAAVCRPMPPAAHTGRPAPAPATSRWSRTKVESSPARPPPSDPRATSPSAPLPGPGTSSGDVTSRRMRRPPPASRSCHGASGASSTVSTTSGRSDGRRGHPAPTRTPKGPRAQRAVSARAPIAASRSRPRSRTPRAPARTAAAVTRASGNPKGEMARTRSRRFRESPGGGVVAAGAAAAREVGSGGVVRRTRRGRVVGMPFLPVTGGQLGQLSTVLFPC